MTDKWWFVDDIISNTLGIIIHEAEIPFKQPRWSNNKQFGRLHCCMISWVLLKSNEHLGSKHASVGSLLAYPSGNGTIWKCIIPGWWLSHPSEKSIGMILPIYGKNAPNNQSDIISYIYIYVYVYRVYYIYIYISNFLLPITNSTALDFLSCGLLKSPNFSK